MAKGYPGYFLLKGVRVVPIGSFQVGGRYTTRKASSIPSLPNFCVKLDFSPIVV